MTETDRSSEFIIETQGLTKEFKGFIAVNNVNLKVRRHSIHALIGPNGAGKTTVFNLITKFLPPTRGSIRFNNQDITRTKPADISRSGLVRSFQISAVFPNMSARENVRIALQQKQGVSMHFWKSGKSLANLDERAMELIEDVGLTELAETKAGELSYGRKRALEIATTLALEPEMLLLDEPTQGMGQEDVSRTRDLILKVAKGRTILMVEHNLKFVSDLSDRITVLQRGEVLAEGSYAEVSANREVVEAYMGSGHD